MGLRGLSYGAFQALHASRDLRRHPVSCEQPGFLQPLRGAPQHRVVGDAHSTGEVLIQSDGTPWRPLVHVEDIAAAFLAVLHAPHELVHDEAFNVGASAGNYRIRGSGRDRRGRRSWRARLVRRGWRAGQAFLSGRPLEDRARAARVRASVDGAPRRGAAVRGRTLATA
jgi:NAD dependent epimerase/dehydratase family